jgi:hypothetical protein
MVAVLQDLNSAVSKPWYLSGPRFNDFWLWAVGLGLFFRLFPPFFLQRFPFERSRTVRQGTPTLTLPDATRIHSKQIVDFLRALADRLWHSALHNPATAFDWLARRLRPFGLSSRNIRLGNLRAKGYDLFEVFAQFLDDSP